LNRIEHFKQIENIFNAHTNSEVLKKTSQQKALKLGRLFENLLKDNEHNSLYFVQKICLDICTLDIIFSSKLTVFLKLCSRKAIRALEQLISADKYLISQSSQN